MAFSQTKYASSTTESQNTGLDPLLTEPFEISEPMPSEGPQHKFSWRGTLKATWREVVSDISSVRWGRGGLWFLFFIWTAGLLIADIIVPLFSSYPSLYWQAIPACKPDGTFMIAGLYNTWNINGFFQITAGTGRLTFTQAKVIDVIWDVCIGRIGQTILVLFSWNCFRLHAMASMQYEQATSITYDTFWTLFMSREVNLTTITGIIYDFTTGRSIKSKTTRIFIVLTMMFVLAWPTIAGAMTGYDSNNTAFVKNSDGTLAPFASFVPVLYVIEDGDRVGLDKGYIVPYCYGDYGDDGPTAYDTTYTEYWYCSGGTYDSTFQNNASDYVEKYGFKGLNTTESIWGYPTNITLNGTALNITAYYIDVYPYYGRDWIDPETNEKPYNDWNSMTYWYNNQIYNIAQIEGQQSLGQCQPDGTYKWGFSFLQAFIALLLLSVWTVAVYIVWLRAHRRLSRAGTYEILNRYKAAIQLSDSINDDLRGRDGDATLARGFSNKDFDQYIKDVHGGSVIMETPPFIINKNPGVWRKIMNWFSKERWWASALILNTVWLSVGWMAAFGDFRSWILFWLTLWIWPSIVFALVVGTTRKSRLFFVFVWTLIGIVVIVPLAEQMSN